MSIGFGPALDAEVSYRQQQARNDFQRPVRRTRRVAASLAPVQHTEPSLVPTQREPVSVPAQHTRRPVVTQEPIHAHVA